MNIISNSCVGGHLYKNNLKCEFKNPFIWEMMDFNSMFYLIKNYHKINWNNYELIKDKNWNFSLKIDNHILVKYVHYKFDRNATKLYVKEINVFSNKIWEYIIQKYEERLKRMLLEKEEPIFIFADRWDRIDTLLTKEQLTKLNDLHKTNIIVAVDKIYPEFKYIKQIERNIIKNHHNDILANSIYEKYIKYDK